MGAIGLANGLNGPSWQSYVTELVPKADLFNAITLNSAQFNGARAHWAGAHRCVLARFGPSMAFLMNGLSFVAVIVRSPDHTVLAEADGDPPPDAPRVRRGPTLRPPPHRHPVGDRGRHLRGVLRPAGIAGRHIRPAGNWRSSWG